MDEEERKRKLEAGKAKFENFRKKKSSKKRKKDKGASAVSTPRDASNSEEVGAGDSIAVQTGDDTSLRALSPSENSELSTTTAEEISTEEEPGYTMELSAIERIQELEITVSDQQIALQKLTLQNKELHEMNQVQALESSIVERDAIISELRDSVGQTADQVRNLQQLLTKATEAVKNTGGEKGEIIAELIETRKKLDTYQLAITRQEETMQQMAKKLEEKSLEAMEASEQCKSLKSELDKSHSLVASSEGQVSAAVQSLRSDFEHENLALRAELNEIHGKQIEDLKQDHEQAMEVMLRKQHQMEQAYSSGSAPTFDAEDVRAMREQTELLRLQLETSYREMDKVKKEHDKEVIQLNQQLVGAVDEYETKLQEEKRITEDLEHRLEMSDTVSSEIQSSFSKQLEQLEEERDHLRQQLRQSQSKAKETNTSKKQIKDLEEELVTYQSELAELNNRIEESEKQRRQLRDEVERTREALDKMQSENAELKLVQSAKLELEEQFRLTKVEHSEELKNLHSQHHRQMEELKLEMEKQVESTRSMLDDEHKEQLGTVKDVHERTHDRELSNLKEDHERMLEQMKEDHIQELDAVKQEAKDVKSLTEDRLRFELKEQFSIELEKEIADLQRRLEQDHDLAQSEMEDKHKDEVGNIKLSHDAELKEQMACALQEQQLIHNEALQDQKNELDQAIEVMKTQFQVAQQTLETEHAETLAKLEAELRSIHEGKEMNDGDLQIEVDNLKKKIEKLSGLEEDYQRQLVARDAALEDERKRRERETEELEKEVEEVKEELGLVQKERDQIFTQAEESQKRLASLQEQQSTQLQEQYSEQVASLQHELETMKASCEESQRILEEEQDEHEKMKDEVRMLQQKHAEKLEAMQMEIDSHRTSRSDLKELRSQLLARSSSVEDMEKMREEMKKAKEELKIEHEQEMEKLRLEHEEEINLQQEKLEQVLSDLQESRDKLEEVTASSDVLQSSPLRSISAMSDYDSSQVAALNKDYRSLMTLTNVANVSGLSELEASNLPEDQMEEEQEKQEHADQGLEDKLMEEDDDDDHVKLVEQLEEMKVSLNELHDEMENMKASHTEALDALNNNHKDECEKLKYDFEAEKEEMMQKLKEDYEKDINEAVEKQKFDHAHEVTQIRLQCASDTAVQVESEVSALKNKLEEEMDSLKHKMEIESSEKFETQQKEHEQALKDQSDELSSSMETRLSAVMSEFHQQKQEAIQKLNASHNDVVSLLKEDLEKSCKDASDKEEQLQTASEERDSLQEQLQSMKLELESLQNEYKDKYEEMKSSEANRMQEMKLNHENIMEDLRKTSEDQHDARLENALQKQAAILQQANEEFVRLHEEQISRFTSDQREDAERSEEEVIRRIKEEKDKLIRLHEEEKQGLTDEHNEELKVVATRLVEVTEEKQQLEEIKNQLALQLEEAGVEKEKDLSELKANLVNQHMLKFQEMTMNLEQHHKEQMDEAEEQHHLEEGRLRSGLVDLQKRIDVMQEDRNVLEEVVGRSVKQDDVDERIRMLEEEHEQKMKELQDEHELHLKQINEEIKKQDEQQKTSYQQLIHEQQDQMENLQKEYDEALEKVTANALTESQKMVERVSELEEELTMMDELRSKLDEVTTRKDELEVTAAKMVDLEQATESSLSNTQKLMERISDLEAELESTENLQEELDQLRARKDELEEVGGDKDEKMQEWEEEREAYEKKLSQLSEEMNASKEELQDLSARIEFERAEYEAEIESVQEDVRVKEETIKEMEAEVDHKGAALDSIQKQHEQLNERRERETKEGDNLLKMLRDDLERISNERDTISSSNERLLGTLTELVRTNQHCEEIITQRLQSLPIHGSQSTVTPDASFAQSAASNTDTDTTTTPLNTSLSGSFIDEGLDLSQRLAESMFAGPELDPQAREVVTGTGTRVTQAVARLLDMLVNTLQQLNVAQQAQTMLGNELERMVENKQTSQPDEDGCEHSTSVDQHHLQELEDQSSRIQDLEKQISDQEEVVRMLQGREDEVKREQIKLEEDRDLLKTQREALMENREEAEINLLQKIEELTQERNLLVQKMKEERDRLTDAARQLDEVMQQTLKKTEEKEVEYISQIEDLKSQIEALRKQTESGSRFNAELTSDREVERDQFEKEMEALRNEIDQVRDSAKSDALLAGKVEQLEEDLDTKQRSHEEEVSAVNTEIETLKDKLRSQEDEMRDIKEKAATLQAEKEESSSSLAELQESKQQHEVLQQELYDNMLRISALEAQLDRYRHGVDEDAMNAQEQADAEERKMREEGREQIAEKDLEIEHLVEQQGMLRSQIIEKEEQVSGLLHEVDHLKEVEAQNTELMEELKKLQETLPPSTQPEQLEALSHHLLEEKNDEIDDLRQQILMLQNQGGGDASAQQMLASLQTQLREVMEENNQLQEQLRSTEEQLDQALEKLEELTTSEEVEVPDPKSISQDEEDGDTGIQEVDLTVGELTRQEEASRIRDLEEENAKLREDVGVAQRRAEDALSRASKDVFNIPSGTKEKIRDLEERLEKEKDVSEVGGRSQTSSTSSEESNEEEKDSSIEVEEEGKPKAEDSNIITKKLLEIEQELKEHPQSVIGRILRKKDEDVRNKMKIVEDLESQLDEKSGDVKELEQQVCQLEQDLSETDVRIKLKDDADVSDADAIQVEQKQKFDVPTIEIEPDSDARSSSSQSSDAGSHPDSVSSSDAGENLKTRMLEMEEEIKSRDDMIDSQEKMILEKERNIEELNAERIAADERCKDIEQEMVSRCKALSDELEELRSSNAGDIQDQQHPDPTDDLVRIKEELDESKIKMSKLKDERDAASQDLQGVQEELTALKDAHHQLEIEMKRKDGDVEDQVTRMQNLEDLVQERESELQQAQQEADDLQKQVQEVTNDLIEMQDNVQQNQEARRELEDELRTLLVEHQEEVDQLQNQINKFSTHVTPDDGNTQVEKQLAEQTDQTAKLKSQSEANAVEIARLSSLNEGLREEIQSLNFKTEELEMEMQAVDQTHKEEKASLINQHMSEISRLKSELETREQIIEEPIVHPPLVETEVMQMQGSSERSMSRSSSLESKSSSDEEVVNMMEEMRVEHQKKMEEMQRRFAAELEEAVLAAAKEQKEQDAVRISDLEEKHRREMSEILSESMNGENEIACRLRAELDLADKLDNKLISQLTETSGTMGDNDETSSTSSPVKDAEISSKLQHLLSRLHNEGVQVLTLSELQFLKQHQGRNSLSNTLSSDTEVADKPDIDIDGLKEAWRNEKLALLDAIQALKELLTQTASEAAQSEEDETSRWRIDLLRSVADLFEREKRALLAELRANVIEAQSDAQQIGDTTSAARLETLERKIRNQPPRRASCARAWDLVFTVELLQLHHEMKRLRSSVVNSTMERSDQHRSELERLLAADRDQLMEEMKQVKEDRKQLAAKSQNRIHELQEQMKIVEDHGRHVQNNLQREVERLSSQLQHEEALISDLKSSLEIERHRSTDLLPSLERERDRTVELSAEIESVSSKARSDSSAANQQIQALQNELQENQGDLIKAENEVRALEEELRRKEEEVINEREKQEEIRAQEEDNIADLKAALHTEEKRRQEAINAVEIERHNVSKLHQELASQRATAYDDVLQLKNRCDELSAAVQAEQGRNDELRHALDHEAMVARQTQEELDSERKTTAEAREHDRATVADLQSILEEAKKETVRVQRRVEDAEEEKEVALQRAREEQISISRRLEHERSSMEEALMREQQARKDLQFALDTEKHRKHEAQQRIRELEDQRRESLRRQEEERLMPRSPRESNESLLAQRRQLESLRQRLQLEATKLQKLVDKTGRPSPREYSSTDSHSTSMLSTDGERVESLKRALDDMQGELKDLYTTLTLPERSSSLRPHPTEFNDKLLQQNAHLADQAARGAREVRELRDVIDQLKDENQRARSVASDDQLSQSTQQNQQKMATRMHKLYTRYLRAESFRKSLVYQKKYLILLLGGFQDCEEATLALIARMGAYPSSDSLRHPIANRSNAYTKFRSAVRAVIAVCRLKFLVRKWKRASTTVSTAIQSKHGIAIDVPVNGVTSHPTRRSDHPTSPYTSRTPSPRPIESQNPRSHDQPPTLRYEPPSHDVSPYMGRRVTPTSPHSATRHTGYRSSYERDLGVSAANSRRLSPAAAAAYASLDRSDQADSDPSLNEYIRKLENLQHKLGQGSSSYRYPV
ncbi:uncharacterized protein LOC100186299 isoform X2 [Ciona intestinalis]